jgi:Tol biopolymer transport system component
MPVFVHWRLTVAAVIVLLVAVACAANARGNANNEAPMDINRIAYIDNDGQLVTSDPDGSGRSLLTTGTVARAGGILAQPQRREAMYSWPVWSPDGSRIAVSLLRGQSPSDAQISLHTLESSTGVGGAAFVNEAPLTIAEGTPHYAQWSPDGQKLGITAATPEGLTLFLVDAASTPQSGPPREPLAVQRGAPLYFDWAPDSASLAVHSNEDVLLVRPDYAAQQFSVQPLARSRSFRTPAWSPDGNRLAWSAPGGDSEALWVGRPDQPDAAVLRLAEVEGACAFLWSADGEVIAVADRQIAGSPAYRRLRLLAVDGSAERTVQEDEWVFGFFWEPRGDRLAWVALNPEERTMEWRIAAGLTSDDAGDETDGALGGFRFSPSGETFLMLAFFDQYARSHSPWAPDGSALVVTGTQQYLSERRNGSSSGGSRVYVVETGDGGRLHDIANGSMAVWSSQ